MTTRNEKKQQAEQLRKDRESDEQRERLIASRRRRLNLLGAALCAIVVVSAAVIVLIGGSGGSAKKSTAPAKTAVYAGIAQSGNLLGSATAPLTIVEYIDTQCPFCARANSELVPAVIEKYVKTGQVNLRVETMSFLGDESTVGAQAAWAAAAQNKMFPFLSQLFATQPQENSGAVTESYITETYKKAGVEPVAALAAAQTQKVKDQAKDSAGRAATASVDSTPTFVIRRRLDGVQKRIQLSSFETAPFFKQIDEALTAAK